MKIAFFTDMYNPYVSGVVTFIDILAEQYVKGGHDVVIFTHSHTTNPLSKKGVRVITFSSFPSLIYPEMRAVFPNPFTFLELVRKEAPDIIHSHTPGILSVLAVRAGHRLGIPTVMTFHGFMDQYYKYVSILKLLHLGFLSIPSMKVYENFKKRIISTVIRHHFNKYDLVTVSTPMTQRVVRKLGIPCTVARIGLDLNTFRQKSDYRKHHRILSVSRIGFEKKIDIVLRALYELHDSKVKLTIVGDGPARKSLENLSTTLKLAQQVTFVGNVKRSELQQYYENHDFFVNASDTETFGYVTAEAMAGGLPIVGVKSQGTGDLVQEGMNGYLAEPNNVQSFTKTIRKMLLVKNYRKMGSASQKYIQLYSPENSAREHLTLYQGMIKKFRKK